MKESNRKESDSKEAVSVRFLYRTAIGRFVLKLLVQPQISQIAGNVLSSGASKCIIPLFIKKHQIDMSDIVIPTGGFASFNDFFTRKRINKDIEIREGYLISPCDGFLKIIEIDGDCCFDIKHTQYSLRDLLDSEELAEQFEGGKALVFRLTPANYHRYCYPADGEVVTSKRIQGILHCVRPIALSTFPVFIQNSREYQVIQSDDFGKIVQMEVGALMVGKIVNHEKKDVAVRAGEEKGYFEFGGSTIILLFQKDAIHINEELQNKCSYGEETKVQLGQLI